MRFLSLWRSRHRYAYSRDMGAFRKHREQRVEPIRKPADLDSYAGCWVAIKDGQVVAAAHNSRDLVPRVRELGESGRGAVAQFVPPYDDAIVIGVG